MSPDVVKEESTGAAVVVFAEDNSSPSRVTARFLAVRVSTIDCMVGTTTLSW